MDYAIVKTGGKQYRVSPGDVIEVEKLPVEEGAKVELTDVLLLSQDGAVTSGSPGVQGAVVIGEVEEQGRGKKVTVFRFKAKTRHGVKTGHRQAFTRLRITGIVAGDAPEAHSQETTEESNDGS